MGRQFGSRRPGKGTHHICSVDPHLHRDESWQVEEHTDHTSVDHQTTPSDLETGTGCRGAVVPKGGHAPLRDRWSDWSNDHETTCRNRCNSSRGVLDFTKIAESLRSLSSIRSRRHHYILRQTRGYRRRDPAPRKQAPDIALGQATFCARSFGLVKRTHRRDNHGCPQSSNRSGRTRIYPARHWLL